MTAIMLAMMMTVTPPQAGIGYSLYDVPGGAHRGYIVFTPSTSQSGSYTHYEDGVAVWTGAYSAIGTLRLTKWSGSGAPATADFVDGVTGPTYDQTAQSGVMSWGSGMVSMG